MYAHTHTYIYMYMCMILGEERWLFEPKEPLIRTKFHSKLRDAACIPNAMDGSLYCYQNNNLFVCRY